MLDVQAAPTGLEDATRSAPLPSVGRIVHFFPYAPQDKGPFAALVVAVEASALGQAQGTTVSLVVFNDMGTSYYVYSAPFHPEPKQGCWTWPPRV